MTTGQPIKCTSRHFKQSDFYLLEQNGSDRRFVASCVNSEKIELLIKSFVNECDKDIRVKICDLADQNNPVDIEGVVDKYLFISTFEKYFDLIFHDGYHEIELMNPQTMDLLAFDEHGLLYIYSDQNYSELLENLGLPFKPNESLITNFDHWHIRTATGQNDLKSFINAIGLKQHNWH
jgi:hypothetical protein